ncbi:uncharacterized protein MELLADRAFT_105123 [Melampsora larici-populina 98AG31]|uniref:Uncharacterized protein n=1 Tax=Melampsora larici-populina (strain 98AG31 / pathotype 3-4-7) TaxID=747676 RepID=F4RHH6_MELLP|nr:uncharacterized protein MELLADRAFT_105123 [Melampsora larici-populina 98AG31]EGG08174.1 hypothetical protein MELLADRAFT_105123 [Melampsora larici-populina 98AG31]
MALTYVTVPHRILMYRYWSCIVTALDLCTGTTIFTSITASIKRSTTNNGYESELTDLSDLEEFTPLKGLSVTSVTCPAPKPPPTTKPPAHTIIQPPAIKQPCTMKEKPAQLKPKVAKKTKNRHPTTKPKPCTHEVPKHLRPDIPAHHYPSSYHRQSMVADYLHSVFQNARVVNVKFDLAVAYFLQHTHHLDLGDIPNSVDKILNDYSLLEPLTGRQDILLTCAHHIKHSLDDVAAGARPDALTPFALQYLTIDALNNLAIEQSKLPVIEQGQKAFIAAAEVNGASVITHCGPMTFKTFQRTQHLPTPTALSPFSVKPNASTQLNGADNRYIEVPGMLNGALPSQAVGFGRYVECSKGMTDTQMALGRNRQGHPSSGWQQDDISHYNLPTLIQMGKEHAYKREDHAQIDSELLWYHKLGQLVIKAFMLISYAFAVRALQVIVKKGNLGAAREIKELPNPLGIGRHTMYSMQVNHHRDGKNAPLFASAIFFGKNYGGGELMLNYLGYAVHGGPGNSVHAAFDVLMHGVGKITCLPNAEGLPPQRICMAVYSHADVFASAARYSGMQQSPKVFSDRRLWSPFYPDNFTLQQILDILKAEQKRLDGKYHEEVCIYQAAKKAAEEAAEKASALAALTNCRLPLEMDMYEDFI